jgi:DNA-binding MarR family transcriptional regulator
MAETRPGAPSGAEQPHGDTRWLSETEQRAWRGLMRMYAMLTGTENRRLSSEAGLSVHDYGILVLLSESPGGSVRPVEIARELGLEKSRLSHQLARLTARGLVDRQRCPTDRRGWFVGVTPEGRRLLEAAAPGHVAAVREAFIDRLTPEQLHTLVEITDAVLSGCPASGPAPEEEEGHPEG